MKRFISIGAVLVLIAVLSGCSGSSGSTVPSTSGATSAKTLPGGKHADDTLGGAGNRLSIALGDAPPVIGNLIPTSINIGIDAVNVIYQGQVINVATYSKPDVVNIMSNNGAPENVGIGNVYSGNYDHIQFVVDVPTSNLVANGTTYPIQFLTAQTTQSSVGFGSGTVTAPVTTTSGSVNPNQVTMTVGGDFDVVGTTSPAAMIQADFNALESLNQNSSGGIYAVPAMVADATVNLGSASGTVLNQAGSPVMSAVVVAVDQSGNVADTANTDSNGNFILHILDANDGGGTYQLEIYNSYTTASGQVITASGADASPSAFIQGPSVTVTAGNTSTLGTLND
ncbi:MAG TPA: carboxypeptidase regulatory-like domain-containing protein [Candidatus Baltobacteraceae bacterium]|nr:carboxypeptidase regulatory-like domain-containing protein [Candidatus Baltobacteraceae bacterium]